MFPLFITLHMLTFLAYPSLDKRFQTVQQRRLKLAELNAKSHISREDSGNPRGKSVRPRAKANDRLASGNQTR